MQEWHFRITGRVVVEGSDANYFIHPENIKSLIRTSDYKGENMPKIILNASLDKNLFDIIVTNAKTATIFLEIDKFQKDIDNPTNRNFVSYIKDEFSIFVSDDINYNKDVDYNKNAEMLDGKREDVYKDCSIGLIPKSCIEANKVFANNVFYQTDMLNMLGLYLMGTHLLIEPLTYNKTMEQLAIPPQETLVKTVEFLNNIKVFYDTEYLFFIDEPYCTYLISRSGQGVEKKDDKYLDVCFNIQGKNEPTSMRPGMAEDIQKNRFYIDISVVDTKYTIDHDTSKIYNKIQEIINPNIQNTISTLDSIQDLVSNIQSTISNVKSIGDQLKSQFEGMPQQLHQIQMGFNSPVNDWLNDAIPEASTNLNNFVTLLKSLPTSIVVTSSTGGSGSSGGTTTSTTIPLYSASQTQSLSDQINGSTNSMNSSYNQVKTMNNNFTKLTSNASSLGYNLGRVDNNFGCFTEVNAQDGVKPASQEINVLSNNARTLTTNQTSQIQNNQHFVSDTKTSYANNLTTLKSILDYLLTQINAASAAGTSSSLTQVKQKYDSMKAIYDNLNNNNSSEFGLKYLINNNLDSINKSINQFKSIPKAIESVGTNFTNCIPDLSNMLQQNLKGKIKNIVSDIQNIGKTAETALRKIQGLGKLGDGVSFGFSDVVKLKDNLDSIGDLTGIGKLGLSCFDTKLMMGGCFGGSKDGIKILRTNNDNANKVKNVKSEMENMVNQLSLNKYDLDPSVFTPNKRYTISNYDGHNSNDGLFLLNKKTEIYFREDDTFVCNTVLDFCKVADSSNGGDIGASGAYSTQDPINKTTQTQADSIAKKNEGLAKSNTTNTSDSLFSTGAKVNASNSVLPYLINNASSGGFGARAGIENIGQGFGTISISDFVRKNIDR